MTKQNPQERELPTTGSDSPATQVNRLVKKAKSEERSGNYPQAIRVYETALDILKTRCTPKKKRQHGALWRILAALYVRVQRVDDARFLYQSYLADLCAGGRVTKLKGAILDSFDIDGVDLKVDLVPIFQAPDYHGLIHQLPQPIMDRLFLQCVQSYEASPTANTYELIQRLLPRVHIELSPVSDDSTSLLAEPQKLLQALEASDEKSLDSLPVPTYLSQAIGDQQQQRLKRIWAERVHGTYMYRGAGYGIRTSMLYMLDMLEGREGIVRVEIEGLEDFDVYYGEHAAPTLSTSHPPRTYVQAKSRNEGQPAWSISQLKDVLNSFAEIHCEDPEANFLFITDYHFGKKTTLTGILDYPHLWAFDKEHDVRAAILNQLDRAVIAQEKFDIDAFLKRVHFQVKGRNLDDEIIERLASFTDSPRAIAARYYDSLFAKVHTLAEKDKSSGESNALSKPELEGILHEFMVTVDSDAVVRPLREGNLELITFASAGTQRAQPDPNYYLGVSANMRHVLADQDIFRPELMTELSAKLVQRNFCILRAPSGTGKTTLMYRFAYEHRHAFSIYRLRDLKGDFEVISACERYIKSLLASADSPVLLLIDDIARPEKHGWQKLLQPLLEMDHIYILATTREDEWNDFLALGINVEYVYPALSEDTAQRFHKMLQDIGQLHPDYPDWQEAYEASKTNETALFMEYTHILTKGKRIEEVLCGQVDRIAQLSTVRMDLLRVISTAHAYGGRVPADLLTTLIETKGESLHAHLQYLVDEHLIIPDQENYVGLHELRSQFVLNLSHRFPPPTLTATLKNLISHLPLPEVAPIIEGVCRNKPRQASAVMAVLADRLNKEESLLQTAQIIRRLYMASEWHHAHTIKSHLDQFEVHTSEVNAFATVLAPAFDKSLELLDGLNKVIRENTLEAFRTAPERNGSERFEQQLGSYLNASALAARVGGEDDVATLVYFFNWLGDANPPLAREVVETANFQHLVTVLRREAMGQRFASLVFHVWRIAPAIYERLIEHLGGRQIVGDKLIGLYPLIARIDWSNNDEEGESIHLQFFAEEPLAELEGESNDESKDIHDKAVFLAEVARRLFPTVSRVKITGLFANGREYKAGVYDPATKNMPADNFTTSEDVERNRIWLKAISNRYTTATWYGYLRQQDTLRTQCISCLNMVVTLLQTVRKPDLLLPQVHRKLTYQIYLVASMLEEASKALLLPPDPEASFLPSMEDRELYLDPLKLIHEHLLQGEYYLTFRTEGGLDQHFRNYIGVVQRFVSFLAQYILEPTSRSLSLLKVNAATAKQNLEKFHRERVKVRLRENEHSELLPIERRLVMLMHQVSQYCFDEGYQDLWQEAEHAQHKIHLLISQLEKQLSGENRENFELIKALSSDLARTFPSLSVFSRLQEAMVEQESYKTKFYLEELQTTTLLGYFAASAQQRYDACWETQLEQIVADLRVHDVKVSFGPVFTGEDPLDEEYGTLPILFDVSDLTDIANRSIVIFECIFDGAFSEHQSFALIITDGQRIIWPLIWTFSFWDRPKWDLATRLGSQADFLQLCSLRTDISDYSEHLDLPIAEEPVYVQALLDIYNKVVEVSLELAQLRYEVSIGRKGMEDVERIFEPKPTRETTTEESEAAMHFEAQIGFLRDFQPAPEFQDLHNDIVDFVRSLFAQVKYEIETLKDVGDEGMAESVESLADHALKSAVNLVENVSSPRKDDEIRARLSEDDQLSFDAMNIPNKFGLIYFVAKNYAHFGRADY